MRHEKSKRLQLRGVHGKRVNLKFPTCSTKADVATFKRVAQRLVQCQLGNIPFFPQDIAYVRAHGEKMLAKLRLLGISFGEQAGKPNEVSLGHYLSRFIASKSGETERKLTETARRLERFFGRDKDMRDIVLTDAFAFKKWLIEHENLAEKSTARRTLGYASQVMEAAVRDGLIGQNPFKGKDVSKAVCTDRAKWHYIDPEQTIRIWNAIQTEEDRIRFVLLRFLGLRAPSEINALTWMDVDWATPHLTIRSTKLRHHKNQGYRTCPISHPNVLTVFQTAYAKRAADDSPIVPILTHTSLTKRVKRWIGAAGLGLWPQLLVNFRRSAVTDACSYLPSHAVAAYFGHCEAISLAHYRMTTKFHAQAFADMPSMLGDIGKAKKDGDAA
jgi:integrase